ncbi:McrC family protein [Streptomyces sp. NPDC033754]|uniref:McrC family protein n=1 Tax=unclassified Streptomyces TaxID=2593676 RepID=UPI0033C7664F
MRSGPSPVPSGPVHELREYETGVFAGVSLTEADRRLLGDGALSSRLRVRELAHGKLEVTATQYVGSLRLDGCEIQVRPKYLGTELDVLRMLDLAWGAARDPLPTAQEFRDGPPNLRDLVCRMVVEHGERLLRHGVRRDYMSVEDDLRVVRGRLLPDRQLLRHHGRLDRLACRFDEHEADIADNRLCAAALALAARTARDPGVRARARRAAAEFAAHAPTPPGDVRTLVSGLVYHRHNEHYRPAHRWARLLLCGGGLDDLFTAGPLAARAFLVDMNSLFESFVTRLVEWGAAGSGLLVSPQAGQRRVLLDEGAGRSHGEVRPDLLISGRRDGEVFRLPVDVKYKLYDTKKLSPADLYQAFLYARTLGRSPGGKPPVCVLLHPGDRAAGRVRVAVRELDGPVAGRVRAVPVDLRAVLGEPAGPGPSRTAARLFTELLG